MTNLDHFAAPTDFDERVLAALRQWRTADQHASPLAGLVVYQRALAAGQRSPRQAVNHLLMTALAQLGGEQADDARLIELRFLDAVPV